MAAFTLLLNICFFHYLQIWHPESTLITLTFFPSKIHLASRLEESEHLEFVTHSVAIVTRVNYHGRCTNMYNETTPCSVADDSTFAYINTFSVE